MKFKMPHLQKYHSPEYEKQRRKIGYVKMSKEDRLKALVLAMKSGKWMQIADLEKATGFKRKRARLLMYLGVELGIVEKGPLETKFVNFTYEWDEGKMRTSKLLRGKRYYRLLTDKINIKVKENPSD